MNNALRIAIAQINSTVGDIEGNSRKILSYVRDAKQFGADVVIFPELAVCGYPPEDLLLKPSFIDENSRAIKAIAASIEGITAIVGYVDKTGGSGDVSQGARSQMRKMSSRVETQNFASLH